MTGRKILLIKKYKKMTKTKASSNYKNHNKRTWLCVEEPFASRCGGCRCPGKVVGPSRINEK